MPAKKKAKKKAAKKPAAKKKVVKKKAAKKSRRQILSYYNLHKIRVPKFSNH